MDTNEIQNPEEQNAIPVVGIGYSAGGFEPVSEILSLIPPDSGVAIVIIQHLQRGHESHLAEVLAKRSTLPVKTISNGIRIEPNTVFVLPPDYDVVLSGDFLNLSKRGNSELHHLGIDFFFSSLSQNRKSRAIGVLLSGAGTDGTLGLKAIKSEGGITIIQDPKTAKFDSMPRSAIGSGIADLILDPKTIGLEIGRLAKHPYTNTTLRAREENEHPLTHHLSQEERSSIDKILEILLDKTTVDFSLYKSSTIRRRIERQLMLRKIETIEKYAEHLQKNPEEVKVLYEDIFIHVTDFFRDQESYNVLKQVAFPEMVKGKNAETPVRIWVPGCATGEEAYSLAISLLEYLDENNLEIPLSIFASDISEPALQKARKGLYADYQLRNVSAKRLSTFFVKTKDGYKISKRVRDLCIFSRHDVTSNPPIPRVDLISCRNVLIYFSAELQKRLFPVFHYALVEHGFLWLGRAENPQTNSKLFFTIDKTHKIFVKSPAALSQQPRFSTPQFTLSSDQLETSKPAVGKNIDVARNADQLILYRYSPPGVLVDHNGDILQFRGRTVPYIEPVPGSANFNVLKMANPDISGPLRLCFQNAKKQNAHVRKEEIEFEFEDKMRKVNIDISPLNPGSSVKDRQYLIMFEENNGIKVKKKSLAVSKDVRTKGSVLAQLETLTEINAQLRQELDSAREYQQSLIEEYESSQEELTSANEELRSTNEELQSTNEELQSTNEELHSTNEELGSAKEELQAANEELLSTNEEVQRRNQELEAALREIDTGERRFRLLVDSVKEYAIFMLDPQGRVATWNEGARRIIGYESNEIIGKHLSLFYIEEEKDSKPPMELSEATKNGKYEDEGWRIRKDGSRFWANVVVTSIRDSDGKLIGYAKVTRDLTSQRQTQDQLRLSEERSRLMIAEVRDYAIFMLDPEGNISSWNEGAKRIKGYESQEVLGTHFSRFYTPEDIKRNHPAFELEIAKKEGRYEEEGWRVKKDGSRFWANVTITRVLDSSGKLLGFAKVTRDLTERRKAEEARIEEQRRIAVLELAKKNQMILENERENFRNLFKETPEMVCILRGPDHVFEFVNEAHVKVLGFDATGMSVRKAQPESVEVHGILDEVYRTGKTAKLHEIPVTVTNRLRHFNLTYSARRNEAGEIDGVMILGTEITEQVKNREELKKAIIARDEFLSIASHELKTPLTSLLIQAQMRRRQAEMEKAEAFTFEKLTKMFDSDKKLINRLTRLIDDMLDVTRISSARLTVRPEAADLRSIVQTVLERMAPQILEAGTTVVTEKLESCPCHVDPFRLEQVLVNLLTNAIRYGEAKPIFVNLEKKENLAILSVRDQGIGIAPEDQKRIFDQFERATQKATSGLGLGLYISKQIIKAHGGTIEVRSEIGKGSTFIVELPLPGNEIF
jgi:two-component system CheB/CheR fusion protein